MQDIRFSNEHDRSGIGTVIGILEKPRLWVPTSDYPDYHLWLEKAEAELDSQAKRAMLAYVGREPVGVILYQQHRTQPHTVEIKNISVSPDVQGRFFGSFLLRNAEAEALGSDFPDCTSVVADTKVTNTGMISFLLRQGYKPEGVADLYGLGSGEDIVFAKTPKPPKTQT